MKIAIVGSGPSAIYTMKHLLTSETRLQITVFEAGDQAGVGTPYDPLTTPVHMLANISSLELPPVIETLHGHLSLCDDRTLQLIGVDREVMTERTFHPRVALGAYYHSQLLALCDIAPNRGHQVSLRIMSPVVDIVPAYDSVCITSIQKAAELTLESFDKVVLATGHTVPNAGRFPAPTSLGHIRHRGAIGILGSSLSAIDIAVSLATQRGSFTEGVYGLKPGQSPFRITMLSRGGRLPEADFYCPLPTTPAPGFTEPEVNAVVNSVPAGKALDAVFMRFKEVLSAADPLYARQINLAEQTADTFASAYFSARDKVHPLAWARSNLEEALRNASDRVTVPWRYTILRCHEPFSVCLRALDAAEMERFNRGLKKVFIDNYAAVPPLSIERLLALHDAGMFDVMALGEHYKIDVHGSEGQSTVTNEKMTLNLDAVYDGCGQEDADDNEFPFPTLRFLLKSNHAFEDINSTSSAIQIDDDYRLKGGINPLRNIWCLSLPFLLERQPFIQGLTSAAKLGATAAAGILADLHERDVQPEATLADLAANVSETQPVFVNGDLVVLTPKQA
jgi:uncharacterized NAD(P)/FAD-binding protein YdhS